MYCQFSIELSKFIWSRVFIFCSVSLSFGRHILFNGCLLYNRRTVIRLDELSERTTFVVSFSSSGIKRATDVLCVIKQLRLVMRRFRRTKCSDG